MEKLGLNCYEQAFENWLLDNRVRYIRTADCMGAQAGSTPLKSFDFLLYSRGGGKIIAEVKGRRFKGTSLAELAGFECWVTTDDVDGLHTWRQILGPDHQAVFVFAYRMKNIDVDFDGRPVFDFGSDRYIFFCIKLDDYCSFMKPRSPKWRTVTLPADKFRYCVIKPDEILL
jgi:hypothetical protein